MNLKELKQKKFELLQTLNYFWKNPKLSNEQKETFIKALEKAVQELEVKKTD